MHQQSILIAEDDEHIARLVSFKLQREGYEISVTRNGQEAVERLPDRSWSLVILDVMMPLQDGWAVLKRIREQEAFARVPVLMLTAKNLDADLAHAARLGATRVLRKPFDPGDLGLVVRKMIEARAI